MAYEELLAHGIELLAPVGSVRSRRMFGGHGIYVDDLFIAIIAFDNLYLRADEGSRATFQAAGCRPFVYEARGKRVSLGYFTVPPEAMESPALMQPWGRLALDAALRAQCAKAGKSKTARLRPQAQQRASGKTGAKSGVRRR